MKWIIILFMSILLLSCSSDNEVINEGKNGMYWASYDSRGVDNLIYQADTKAKICFAIYRGGSKAGMTEISCDKLALRPEWKAIITWSDQK